MKLYFFNILILLMVNLGLPLATYAQLIPQTETDFTNPSNFPTVPGDAMTPSRTNYYRAPGYAYTKKADGSLYLSTGGWGASQVDANGNLVKYLNRYNHATNGSYYLLDDMKPWDLSDSSNQFENGFFRLYTNLKLTNNNPTQSNSSSDLKTLRRATSNESFPYFNSYPNENGNLIYNWQVWLYPIYSGVRYVDPKKANNVRNNTITGGGNPTIVYRDYNYLTLRDTDTSNDLTPNDVDQNYELDLSVNSSSPTTIYSRINSLRDKLILSIWYGYQPLAGTASKPLADLRISNWDSSYKMYYKLWFNGLSAVTPSSTSSSAGTEYSKIYLANQIAQGINNENNGEGADIREFNKKFDELSDVAEDMLSGGTESAMEIKGVRQILFNNDIDPYGKLENHLNLKFRMLSVGMTFNVSKIAQRVYNTMFTASERLFNPTGSGYTEFKNRFEARGLNFFHPKHPFGLTQEHFINITTTRPVIKFDNTVASPTSAYLGTAIEMKQGENFLTPIALIIEEQVGALLPFQEIEATQLAPTIDPARIRVSLVKKSDYDAAVISSVSLNGFDALNNPMPNNDLPTLTNFSYLSQENFINNQNDIPTGEYYIKYDYSSPDSNVIIKNEGDKLGNVFAKSIYRSLVVLPNSISRVNPNLRIRVSN